MEHNKSITTSNLMKHFIRFLPYGIFFIILLLYHKYMNLATGDDSIFAKVLTESNLIDFTAERYTTWSSRFGVEAVVVLVAHYPILFHLLNIAVYMGIMFLIFRLLNIRTFASKILVLTMLLFFDPHNMSSAGWIATTINYMWVVASVLWFAYLLKLRYYGEWHQTYWGIVAFVLLFAGSHEQGIVIILGEVITYLYLTYKNNKKNDFSFIIVLAVSVLLMLIILVAPGNAARTLMAVGDTNPDFVKNNFVEKIWLGIIRYNSMFLATSFRMFNMFGIYCTDDDVYHKYFNHIFSIFSIILFISAFKGKIRKKSKIQLFAAAFPLFLVICYYISVKYPMFENPFFAKEWEPCTINYNELQFYLPLLFTFIFIASFFYYLYKNYNKDIFVVLCMVFLIGFATQVMMGLSPTIYRSHTRTSIFMFFSFLILTAYIFNSYMTSNEKSLTFKHLNYFVVGILLISSFFNVIYNFIPMSHNGY